ncbi:2-nitropropane dioxygenase [Salipaludibacillus keqinensis]|uniref:Probable nitronate monooxygenase n=1 Tax=Salipaludibacillus keqinensis TaxID=2045207 RepID=A0A323TJV2_9BACI|nr:nitronate monooxygenase family protein [Salipaludibacillus keqinensis]PYZ94850.1 2-nitropropane dioxygenase [Salipaludibacillus keqinensis]
MNELVKILNIELPFIQGGMGNVSHASLAIAVSEAGGLGTIGAGTLPPKVIKEMIAEIRAKTNKPYAVNVPLSVQPHLEEVISLLIEYQVPVVSLSAGNPAPFIQPLKEAKSKVMCVVANHKQALKAEAAGADIIIAEGYEAAGINSTEELTTFTLIPKITSVVNIPVVAAGGIGNGKGFLAALALGAQGVQLGTRLIATQEANVHENYKAALCDAEFNDTVIVGRPYQKIRRILKTPYADKLIELEKQEMNKATHLKKTDETHHILGAIEGKLDQGHINAGQISSLIEDIPTVSELFNRMIQESTSTFKGISSFLPMNK